MNRCNYCILQDLIKRGMVVLKPAPKPDMPDGVDVFIDYGRGELVWAAWFMRLSDHCVC